MAWTRRYEDTEPQRVNRWLGQNGVCSRREAEALILQGRVRIDGEVVTDAGRKIAFGQTLTVEAEDEAPPFTAVLNKPIGYVSGQPEHGQIPAVRLLRRDSRFGDDGDTPSADASLPPLGRLDLDSRGLLLLSQDGVLAKAVIGPESRLDKEYIVEVVGQVTGTRLQKLRHGLSLDGRALRPAKVTVIGDQRLRFVLNEGRKRQIRRMCELVDLSVVDLLRVRIGPLVLGDLPEGRWRLLRPEERAAIIAEAATQQTGANR